MNGDIRNGHPESPPEPGSHCDRHGDDSWHSSRQAGGEPISYCEACSAEVINRKAADVRAYLIEKGYRVSDSGRLMLPEMKR